MIIIIMLVRDFRCSPVDLDAVYRDSLVLSASHFDPKEIKGQSLQTQFTVLPPSESSHIAIVLLR